jgi:hypothetical protein
MTDVAIPEEIDFNDADTERFAESVSTGKKTFKQIGFAKVLRAVIKGAERVVTKKGHVALKLSMQPLVGEADDLTPLQEGRLKDTWLTLPFTNPHVDGHEAPNTFGFLSTYADTIVEDLPNARQDKRAYTDAVMQFGKAVWADPDVLREEVVTILTNTEEGDTYNGKTSSFRGIDKVVSPYSKKYTPLESAEDILV